jgi:hypothetical protein
MGQAGGHLQKMTGRRTRQTSDAMLTSSEHPIALSHTPARSNPQITRSPWSKSNRAQKTAPKIEAKMPNP